MAFLEAQVIDKITAESSSSGRFVNPAKCKEETRLRLLGEGITGYTIWTEEGKPLRWETMPEEVPENARPDMNGSTVPKRFIAAWCWDYQEGMIKILEITQKTVMQQLAQYLSDEDYGAQVETYDIKIKRNDNGGKVSYDLKAAPPKPMNKQIQAAWENHDGNLKALFDGEDPFASMA